MQDSIARLVRLLLDSPRPLPLRGRLQPYAWGGQHYLRGLTGLTLPGDAPAAEWWIGAHPLAPAIVTLPGLECPLDALVAAAPAVVLGERVAAAHAGRLPFLLKVLDVRQMLSIQAHPTRRQAEAGYARENAAGIPLDAPHRTYRDDNHKPEAQVALTRFWTLSGFRAPADMAAVLRARPELSPLATRLDRPTGERNDASGAVRALYTHVMRMPQEAVDAMLGPLVDRLQPAYAAGDFNRASPDFWAARAASAFGLPGGHHDRGIVSIYLLNLLELEPGDATFFGAGLLHAYLEGAAVEIMANSDNVIRGGLTPKHVDVDELLRVLAFEPAPPVRLGARASDPRERRYDPPAPEFALARYDLDASPITVGPTSGPDALIVVDGAATLRWSAGTMDLPRGGAALVPAGLRYALAAPAGALAFRAHVP